MDDLHIVFSLSNVRSSNEKRNPVVAAIAVEVGCMEVISVKVEAAIFINKDNDVDLVVGINVILLNSSIGQSHISTIQMKGRIGRNDFIETHPSKLIKNILISILEQFIIVKILNFLPFGKISASSVENRLVNFQERSLLDAAVVGSLIGGNDESWKDMKNNSETVIVIGNRS